MIARTTGFVKAAASIGLYLMLGVVGAASAEVYVVTSANHPVNEIAIRELRSIYKGRLSQVNGHSLKPLNAAPGTTDRDEFLQRIMNLNELITPATGMYAGTPAKAYHRRKWRTGKNCSRL